MDTETQYQAAQYVSALLVFVGLIAIGMGVAYWHAASAILSTEGMQVQTLTPPDLVTAQADIARQMNQNAWLALLIGAFSVGTGSGMMYYINNHLP